MTALEDSPTARFQANWEPFLRKPRPVVVASAHFHVALGAGGEGARDPLAPSSADGRMAMDGFALTNSAGAT